MMLFVILMILVLLTFAWVSVDLVRFSHAKRKADKKADALKMDAGGYLFVQGGKTYYTMPNGMRRKIADYPFDLNKDSPDMVQFLATMEQARKEKHAEASNNRKEALTNMREIAKEEAKL